MRSIEIVRARTHNLKNVSCSIPVGELTVITGPSGSGKSSLAFDTLYAEGQRRFVESMSTYARQFLSRMERPDVDAIEHVLPAIAIAQSAPARTARSTVGTSTEVDDVLRLVFASIGRLVCPTCQIPVARETPHSVLAALLAAWGVGAKALVVAARPVVDLPRQAAEWRRSGLFRALDADGTLVDFGGAAEPPVVRGATRLVVGRHVVTADDHELLRTLEEAFAIGEGELLVRHAGTGAELRFLRGLGCNRCGAAFQPPTPALFSFNSPRGACESCQGFGRVAGIDVSRVIPDPSKSLDERPVAPFNSPAYEAAYDELRDRTRKQKLRWNVPWSALTQKERDLVWNGSGDWYGVKGLFEYLEKKRYKVHVRVFLSRYRGYTVCPACGGARLRPEALAFRVGGKTLPEIQALPFDALTPFLRQLDLTGGERDRAGHLVADVGKRVTTLIEIGLPYLTLSRQMRTLSGGEAQRIQLGSAIGNALTGTLYVLDEPTVGLHAVDTARLLTVLKRLAAGGNAVVVVEHDLDVIRNADQVIDLGPRAGAHGGALVFAGTPAELSRADTATGRALAEERELLANVAETVRPFRARAGNVRVVGARANNLKNLTVDFPLGMLVGVSGVSGSGKSSLVVDVLANGAARKLAGKVRDEIGEHDRIDGLDALAEVVLVDQSPLGRSARSNPATYTKAWDGIRALYARSARARALGLTPGSFSFNAAGGRCETCEGSGVVSIDMQFLADVTVVCEACEGKRFGNDVLAVRVRGRTIHDLLETTVEEARTLFEDLPSISDRLAPLADAGLSYLRLGQSTSTLSGGEAQRLKLAAYLGATRGRTLFVFDEPTTGLHPSDVSVLLGVLRRLIQAGNSVIAVEHHVGFLKSVDHLVELGPGGGERGGDVVFSGPVSELIRRGKTPTATAFRGERYNFVPHAG